MPVYETLDGRATVDARPVPSPEPNGQQEHGRIFTRVREAAQQGTLDDVAEAIVREAVGYPLADPYMDTMAMQGYRDIGGVAGPGPWQGPIDLEPEQRRQEVMWARTLAAFSPPAKNALRLHRTYVLGQGIPMPTAQDADVQEVIEDFWSDPANEEIASHNGQAETDASWLITGELFLALFVDDDDGHVKVRSVEPLDVESVVTHPDDRRRILYYRVRRHRDSFNFATGQGYDDVTPGGPDEFVYFPDWANTGDDDPYSGRATPLAAKGAVMASFPLNRQGVRGIPELTAAIPWIQAHKRLLENQSVMANARRTIALVKTVKGGPQAVSSSAALEQSSLAQQPYAGYLERNPARAPGSTYVKNKGIELEYPDLSTGADDAQRDAEMHAQMIGSALGWGTHYLLMSTEFHRLATAVTMELPTLKMCLEGQQRWLDMLRSVLDYALLWAAKKGKINAPVIRKHGRALVDWKNAQPAPPKPDDEHEQMGPAADVRESIAACLERLAVASSLSNAADHAADQFLWAAARVREMEPQDAVAQAAHSDQQKNPEQKAQQAKQQRGHYEISMPEILDRDRLPNIQAIEAAAQAGHITPKQAAREVMNTLGFGEITDAMREWEDWVAFKADQVKQEQQQAVDMAHKQLAAKAGPPGGATAPGAEPALPGTQGAAAPSGGLSRNPVAREAAADVLPAWWGLAEHADVREAAGGGHWVTIEEEGIQTHIFIQNGRVTKGPAGLIGAQAGHLPPGPNRTVTHHPAGHEPAGAREHPHYTEHQPPPKPEPLPGKPYARLSGAPQTRQEQPDERPQALSQEETEAGLNAAHEATRAHEARQHVQTEQAIAEAKRAAGLAPEREHMAHVRERFSSERDALIRKANPRIRKGSPRWDAEAFKDEHIRPAWAAAHRSVAENVEAAHSKLLPHERQSIAGRRLAEDARWHRAAAQQYGNDRQSYDFEDDPEADRAVADKLRPHLHAYLDTFNAEGKPTSERTSAEDMARVHADVERAQTPQAMALALAKHAVALVPWLHDRQKWEHAEQVKRLISTAANHTELDEGERNLAYYSAHALHNRAHGPDYAPDLDTFNKDVHATLRHLLADDVRRTLASRLAHDHAQRQFARGLEDVRAGRRSAEPQIVAGPAPVDQSHHYLAGTAPHIIERANERAQRQYGETQQGAHDALAALPEHMRRLIAAAGTTTYAHGNYASDTPAHFEASHDAGGQYNPHLRHAHANTVHICRTERGNARLVGVHEYAHAHDEALGRARNGARAIDRFGLLRGNATFGHWRSEEPDMRALYSKYKNDERLPDYMRTNPHEFYAEGMAWHHGHSNFDVPQDKLREVAPDLADKFDQIMRESEEAAHGHGHRG